MRIAFAALLVSVVWQPQTSQAMLVTFDWVSVGSDEDLSRPLFPLLLGGPIFPDTKVNGGIGTVTSLVGLPATSSVVATPSDLTFHFGSTTDPAVSPALVLTGFDNGDATGIAVEQFTPMSGVTDNTFRVFNAGVPVAIGELLGVAIFTDTTLMSTGIGSFRLTMLPMGADPTFLNEVLSLTGGTGLVNFTLTDFLFEGVAEFQGGAVFTSTGIGVLATPEPSTCLLLGLSAIPLAWWRRRGRAADPPPAESVPRTTSAA